MTTQQKLIDSARRLIQSRGYNGFSYADVAEEVQVRKASIHHHFPAKSDLAKAVIEASRSYFVGAVETLTSGPFDPMTQLRMYTGYWEKCIVDDSAPFCVAGMLASELPTLPDDLADSVHEHFRDLSRWVELVLTRGAQDGTFVLERSARQEAESFMATVYGGMMMARAFRDPKVFCDIVDGVFRHLAPRA